MWPWGNSSKTANDHTQGALEPEKKKNAVSSQQLRKISLPLSNSGGLGKMGILPGDFCTRGFSDTVTIMPHFPL